MKKALQIMMTLVVTATGSFVQAGAIGGWRWGDGEVKPSEHEYHEVAFAGGEVAKVRLHGFGKTWLSLQIYDKKGRLVAIAHDRDGDEAVATWLPACSASYLIMVDNPAPVANSYLYLTN